MCSGMQILVQMNEHALKQICRNLLVHKFLLLHSKKKEISLEVYLCISGLYFNKFAEYDVSIPSERILKYASIPVRNWRYSEVGRT